MIVSLLQRIQRDTSGGVSIIGALSLVSMVGMSALSIELGQGYQAKIGTQSVADAAALAAANAYASNKSDSILSPTAKAIGHANGIDSTRVTVTQLTNYSESVGNAVQVTVSRDIPLFFARIFSSAVSYTVSSSAVAPLSSNTTPPCFIALSSSSSGITLSGGTSIDAPNCALNSNAKIDVSGGSRINSKATNASGNVAVKGGSRITADNIVYGGAASAEAGSFFTGNLKKQSNNTPDPMEGNQALADALAKLGNFDAPAVPSVPTGDDMTLNWYPTTMTFQGRTATMVNGTWTFPAGTYNFRNLNTSSLKLKIEGPSTVTVSSSVTVGGGGGLIIGDGDVSIKAPINLSGGTTMTLGAGRHYTGQITVGGGSSVTMGAGDLDVNGAIMIDGGGSKFTVGAGDYRIGNNGAGTAINLSGGSYASFGNGKFSANGNVLTSGGSTIVFGNTANHLINGNLSLNGSSTFGMGTYTINGFFTNNTGGSMTGTNVTFIAAGTLNVSGGTSINLIAPTVASGWGIPDLLFATMSTAATKLGGGNQSVLGGLVYFPNSALDMTGGTRATGQCFMVVAKSITLASGPAAATYCDSMSGGSSTQAGISLVR